MALEMAGCGLEKLLASDFDGNAQEMIAQVDEAISGVLVQ